MKHLGTQTHAKLGVFTYVTMDGLQVYQIPNIGKPNGEKPVWFCSISAWENAMHKVCDQ